MMRSVSFDNVCCTMRYSPLSPNHTKAVGVQQAKRSELVESLAPGGHRALENASRFGGVDLDAIEARDPTLGELAVEHTVNDMLTWQGTGGLSLGASVRKNM
jgi:hypothetical protein